MAKHWGKYKKCLECGAEAQYACRDDDDKVADVACEGRERFQDVPVGRWATCGLGEKPDREIAKALGVHYETVMRQRLRLGIRLDKKPTSGPDTIVDWDAQPLGSMSDEDLSEIIGCNPESVRRRRVERGIPSFGNRTHKKRRA